MFREKKLEAFILTGRIWVFFSLKFESYMFFFKESVTVFSVSDPDPVSILSRIRSPAIYSVEGQRHKNYRLTIIPDPHEMETFRF